MGEAGRSAGGRLLRSAYFSTYKGPSRSCGNHPRGKAGTKKMSEVIHRANDVLKRADLLDDAVAELHGYRSLLEDLNCRSPVKVPREQVRAIRMVRAAILRSAIGLAVAILDPTDRRGNRASLGHIIKLLDDKPVADLLFSPNPKWDSKPIRQRLCEVHDRYNDISTGPLLQRVRDVRHNANRARAGARRTHHARACRQLSQHSAATRWNAARKFLAVLS
jgi:hypothetical protein